LPTNVSEANVTNQTTTNSSNSSNASNNASSVVVVEYEFEEVKIE